jgi:hypothetical protein
MSRNIIFVLILIVWKWTGLYSISMYFSNTQTIIPALLLYQPTNYKETKGITSFSVGNIRRNVVRSGLRSTGYTLLIPVASLCSFTGELVYKVILMGLVCFLHTSCLLFIWPWKWRQSFLLNIGELLADFFFFFYSCSSRMECRASVKISFLFSFLICTQSVGPLAWGISPSQGRYLTETQNKLKQASMPWLGFEPTISVFERAKIFHALDGAATVIGYIPDNIEKIKSNMDTATLQTVTGPTLRQRVMLRRNSHCHYISISSMNCWCIILKHASFWLISCASWPYLAPVSLHEIIIVYNNLFTFSLPNCHFVTDQWSLWSD